MLGMQLTGRTAAGKAFAVRPWGKAAGGCDWAAGRSTSTGGACGSAQRRR